MWKKFAAACRNFSHKKGFRLARWSILPVAFLTALVSVLSCDGEDEDSGAGGEFSDVPSAKEHEPRLREFKMEQPMMGTLFTIRVYVSSVEQADRACKKAFGEGKRLESLLSSRDERSELASFNRVPHGTFFPLSPELSSVLKTALYYAEKTGGAFDPTLGPCIRLWRRAGSRKQLPDVATLEKARAASGFRKLVLDGTRACKTVPGMRIDLGGIGKGMAVDAMGRILEKEGVSSYCVSSTSDVLVGDPPPGQPGWRVALDQEGKVFLRPLKREAVSTSGAMYRHVLVSDTVYSHVIDPETGLGSIRAGSVTVLAPTATCADALSTACSALGEKGARLVAKHFPEVEIRFHDDAKNAPVP